MLAKSRYDVREMTAATTPAVKPAPRLIPHLAEAYHTNKRVSLARVSLRGQERLSEQERPDWTNGLVGFFVFGQAVVDQLVNVFVRRKLTDGSTLR